ncbi:MAG TPA: DUF6125 family protein [Candidatus Lokiarchaeia archaeon]|nr:DUF6125 family protein [Candidatus Lokiarchaeia archaeon]
MAEPTDIDPQKLLDLAIYSFLRLDGAWFLAASERFGVEAATDLDVRAWEAFSERLGKKIIATTNLTGDFAEILPTVFKIQNMLMNMKSTMTITGPESAVLRVDDCEVWKMVSKVWDRETAPCYKITQASIRGLLRGAFPGMEFEITQKQLIPMGDPCCEVEIIVK